MNTLLNLYRGRIGRRNYLLGLIVAWMVSILSMLISMGFLTGITWVLMTFFMFSLHVRRLHDMNRSGWMALMLFIPLVNLIVFLWIVFSMSQEEGNRFGKNLDSKSDFLDSLFNLKYK